MAVNEVKVNEYEEKYKACMAQKPDYTDLFCAPHLEDHKQKELVKWLRRIEPTDKSVEALQALCTSMWRLSVHRCLSEHAFEEDEPHKHHSDYAFEWDNFCAVQH
eukprot:m.80992 g.80992  ORF g.80992 m.80992 type:complete len:105 (-) comp12620_c0_seq6:3469-3783(-)